MMKFLCCVFSVYKPRRLNRFRLHMQVMFLSDIMIASGKILEGKYLVRRKIDVKWSKLNFPKEQPPNKYFNLWKAPIRQVAPVGGIMDWLGNLTQAGHKIWNWRHDEENSRLLNYIEGVMDIYKATELSWYQNKINLWTRVSTNQPAEINRNICSVL